MEYLQQTVMGFFSRILINKENSPPTSGIDLCLSRMYMILTWQDFDLTLGSFFVVNILLWLIVRFEIRFYATLCMTLLMLLLCHLYCEIHNIGNDPGAFYSAGHQVNNYITSRVVYLKKLRKENPAIFCIVMSGLFCLLSCVSKVFSGLQVTYFVVFLLFSLPPVMSSNVEVWKYFLKVNSHSEDSDSSTDDFSADDLNDEIESLINDRSTDSFTNSIENELTSMPSYSEIDVDCEEPVTEEKLLIDPTDFLSNKIFQDSDSDSERRSMNFVSTHFKNDSSSSDEDLDLSYVKAKDVSKTQNIDEIDNLSSVSSDKSNSSSDSEFELIDFEVVNMPK